MLIVFLWILALVLFILAGTGVAHPRWQLGWLGQRQAAPIHRQRPCLSSDGTCSRLSK